MILRTSHGSAPCLGPGASSAHANLYMSTKMTLSAQIGEDVTLIHTDSAHRKGGRRGRSDFPLSIVLVGFGDDPWDMMKEFDDNIPARAFDNFQFVNSTEIMSKKMPEARKESTFALEALMEIPSQYRATLELGILGRQTSKSPERVPLPPPIGGYAATVGSNSFKSTSFKKTVPTYSSYETLTTAGATPAPSSSYDNHIWLLLRQQMLLPMQLQMFN